MAGNYTSSVCATEQWIKKKLNLDTNALDTITALSLPGKYHEKISQIGRSLLCFSNLRSLDLSRNALKTLEGLDHLKHLESLNLYYNNVPDLREVFKLRHNTKLQDVDLRLNPVTKAEPDYRLFLIHMLIHLRTLDERSVTDEERKAALMHFDTDQAYDFDSPHHNGSPLSPLPTTRKQKSSVQSRVDLVQSIRSKPNGFGIDTDEFLTLMAERGLVGGTVFVQTHKDEPTSRKDRSSKTKKSNDKEMLTSRSEPLVENTKSGNTVLPAVVNNRPVTETQAYSTSQPMINYTPHPSKENIQPSADPTKQKTTPRKSEVYDELRHREELIAMVKSQVDVLAAKVAKMEETKEGERDTEQTLKQAHSEITRLQQNCQSLLSENISLRSAASPSPLAADNRATTINSSPEFKQLISDIGSVKEQHQFMCNEVRKLSERQNSLLSHSSQLQNLAAMLQDTHKSLVSTNSHLLHEIESMKRNHALEIAQLQLNYEQLRKSLQKIKQ